mgnify:CR=1 FL=1|tara:strand:- start:1717 stop:2028 length:312 start_codon:yes stop_codon:yes gene_type:complete
MAWLKLSLPLEEEFQVEQQVRHLREHDDLEELQEVASNLFPQLYYQQNLTGQLIRQVAELEYRNAVLAKEPLPPHNYMEWARSMYPHDPPAPHENDLAEYASE